MSSKSLPPALEPYLRLPPETSLTLLTSTLGCSINWLVARFVGAALSPSSSAKEEAEEEDGSPAILLVSWLRDLSFWKTELRRTTGLDLAKLTSSGHFAFIDCSSSSAPSSSASAPSLSGTEHKISQALSTFPAAHSKKIILILDSPDILLATASASAQDLNLFLLNLRSYPRVHATYLSVSADLPLVAAAAAGITETRVPVEAETAAFVASQAHASRVLFSVRELETGAAKDVSGVLRVTRGGDVYGFDDEEDESGEEMKEAELLYLVQRDGNAKVFERGADTS